MKRAELNIAGHVSLRVIQLLTALWSMAQLWQIGEILRGNNDLPSGFSPAEVDWARVDMATDWPFFAGSVIGIAVLIGIMTYHKPESCGICQRGITPDDWQKHAATLLTRTLLRWAIQRAILHTKLDTAPAYVRWPIRTVWLVAPIVGVWFTPWGVIAVAYIWLDFEATTQYRRFQASLDGWAAARRAAAQGAA